MPTLRLIFGDQLSHNISALRDANKVTDIVMLCEVASEATFVPHHRKKIAFLFSAMRHFAAEIQAQGFSLHYTKIDDPLNTGSFDHEIARVLALHPHLDRIVVTHPGEYRVLMIVQSWQSSFQKPVEIREDDRFLCSLSDFKRWADGRKNLRMEFFYRLMRQRLNILMNGDEPEGGQWNFDASNRKPPPKNLTIPAPFQIPPDDVTRAVLDTVACSFPHHFGDLEPFHWATTRADALKALSHFISERLPFFGDYQDAMVQNEPWMFHAHLSFYINCGLLDPWECVQAAAEAYKANEVPLNAAEGFIRQIIGWREYIRGIYWLKMPDYATLNYFEANKSLPDFYWSADTSMNCVKQCVTDTKRNAYAHHIQRLMVLGNFALLAGIDPREVNTWFLVVYADAYEWVELPNVSGMILFADGGYLASKPYASGGSYIRRMSNYCDQCHYDVNKKSGPEACPFNYLYWDFLARNRAKLKNNQRLSMMYATYDRMQEDSRNNIHASAKAFLASLDATPSAQY